MAGSLPIVQSVLNTTAVVRLGKRSPLKVFTGITPKTPLLHIKLKRDGHTKISSISEIKAKQCLTIENLQKALQ